MIDNASEVQGECRAELARAMLSRSLHSYSKRLVCEYKGTKIILYLQILTSNLGRFLARI